MIGGISGSRACGLISDEERDLSASVKKIYNLVCEQMNGGQMDVIGLQNLFKEACEVDAALEAMRKSAKDMDAFLSRLEVEQHNCENMMMLVKALENKGVAVRLPFVRTGPAA